MERDPDLRPATDRFEHLQEIAPQRSIYWGLQNIFHEAEELLVTDPNLTPIEFRQELADVQIAIWKVLQIAGINRADFYERIVVDKEDIIIDRFKQAYHLNRMGGVSLEEAYEEIKSRETNP